MVKDREACRSAVHGVTKSRTWLSDWTTTTWSTQPWMAWKKVKMKATQMCLTLQPLGLTSPGQNTGVGSLSLLQGIIPTQGSNPTLQEDSLPAEPQGKPKKVEWVAYSFSSRSFQPRNQTRVSCITGRFFYQLSYQDGLLYHKSTDSVLSDHGNPKARFLSVSFLISKLWLLIWFSKNIVQVKEKIVCLSCFIKLLGLPFCLCPPLVLSSLPCIVLI